MRRRRDRTARAQALAAARSCQEVYEQATARRREPSWAGVAIERSDARMDRVRIAHAGAYRHLFVDKGRAEAMRETTIKKTVADRPACEQSGLRRDGLPACLRGREEQNRRAHTIGGEKR